MRNLASDHRGSFAFGGFRLSADGTLLVRDGHPVTLAPKVLKTLLVLVERAGQVVTKDDLIRAVWPDSFVEETGLSRNISLLRQALGDDAQQTIVTITRVGYRFAAPVVQVDAPAVARPEGSAVHVGPEAGARRASGDEAVRPSRLLVLPFRLLREDPDTGFLAFSVPDAVVNALSGLQALTVRSSALAARFGSDPLDLPRIAAEADVDTALTGTLVRAGQQIRATAQLLAVPSGTVLWSQSLQVTLRDVFALQDTLVTHIVRSLSLSLSATERRRLESDVPKSARAYEYFLRGNEAIGVHAISSSSNLRVARELYTRAVEEDPDFAPAWARLGRCLYLIGKFDGEPDGRHVARAEACFQRALELSPDLPLAHGLYALFEIDQGCARNAMVRLIARGLAGDARADLYAALVQACRFCGLLEASLAAHERARALDASIVTSVYHTYWHLGDDERALRATVRAPILEALVAGMRGRPERAIEILREREAGATAILQHMMAGIRAVFECRPDAAREHAQAVFDAFPDPEAVFYVARALAFFGEPRALQEFGRAQDRGYVLYRLLIREDPWLDPLRSATEFAALVDRAGEAYRQCVAAYVEAGGERLLGPVPAPDEPERHALPG